MPLDTAVVGAGTVSNTHLTGIEKNPRTELVGVCDINEEQARDAADRFNVESYCDVDEMLADTSLDWLHICTPVQTHFEISKKAIAAGVPQLIEKPVTVSVDEIETLTRLANENDVPVSPVHQHLFDPAVLKAREMIESGELGRIRGVDLVFSGHTKPNHVNRGSWVFDLPGGEFEEGLPHPIYLALGFAGYPDSVSDLSVTTALAGEYDQDFDYDSVQVQYVTEDDTLCQMKMLSGGQSKRVIHVHGEEKTLTVDILLQMVHVTESDFNGSLSLVKQGLTEAGSRIAGIGQNARLVAKTTISNDWDTKKMISPHHQLYDETARAIESGSEMPVPLSSARWTIRTMDAIREEAAEKRSETKEHHIKLS